MIDQIQIYVPQVSGSSDLWTHSSDASKSAAFNVIIAARSLGDLNGDLERLRRCDSMFQDADQQVAQLATAVRVFFKDLV